MRREGIRRPSRRVTEQRDGRARGDTVRGRASPHHHGEGRQRDTSLKAASQSAVPTCNTRAKEQIKERAE